MSGEATTSVGGRPVSRQPRLAEDAGAGFGDSTRVQQGPVAERTGVDSSVGHILVAGADTDARARMLSELRHLLPADTEFLEGCETWEVLARAAGSRMVVLADDLSDISTESLVRLLARKHPTLPVLTVGRPHRLVAQAASAMASG